MFFQARIRDGRGQLLCEYSSTYPHSSAAWTDPSDSLHSEPPHANFFNLLFFSSVFPLSQIYTGGAPLTDAVYDKACPFPYAPPAAVSPAYKRKRSGVESSPFVGGKVWPIGEQACPISSSNAFECINVKVNLA